MNTAIKWLEAGYIQDRSGKNLETSKLNWSMKESIIKAIYEKPQISLETKQKLLTQVIGDEKSDLAENLRLACEARIPSKDSKAKVWKKIIDKENKLSSYQRKELMDGFFTRDACDSPASWCCIDSHSLEH